MLLTILSYAAAILFGMILGALLYGGSDESPKPEPVTTVVTLPAPDVVECDDSDAGYDTNDQENKDDDEL